MSKNDVAIFRYCNCDIGDEILRSDAGVFSTREDLPIDFLKFNLGSNPDASASLTLGPYLYCSDKAFGGYPHTFIIHCTCVTLGIYRCNQSLLS